MKTEIYYFTGTGNSLSVAKSIAGRLNCDLISIASTIKREIIKTDADKIGIVFPCYLAQRYGIPLIVEQFVRKIEGLKKKYIFAVCTCGGWELVNALPTLKRLNRVVKSAGGRLTGEFTIKLPMNNLKYPTPFINQNQALMFQKCADKIEDIVKHVSGKKTNPYKTVKTLLNLFLTPFYLMLQNLYVIHLKKMAREPIHTKLTYFELIPLSDRSISVTDKCTGCGICAKVCPVHNIKIVENKPVWQHHCEMCLACDEWCPGRAIRHWCKTEGKNYRHPDIKIADMLMQSEGL